MSFFNRLFKKQGQPNESAIIEADSISSDSDSPDYVRSDEDFKVCIKTDKELSEEQQDAIFSIVKTGLYKNNEIPSKVCITLMLSIGIMESMILNRTSEGSAELIFQLKKQSFAFQHCSIFLWYLSYSYLRKNNYNYWHKTSLINYTHSVTYPPNYQ